MSGWSQRFNESGIGWFDTIGVVMTTAGDSFESDESHAALWGFTDRSWEIASADEERFPTVVVAGGATVRNLSFQLQLPDSTSPAFEFQLVALLGDHVCDHVKVSGDAADRDGAEMLPAEWKRFTRGCGYAESRRPLSVRPASALPGVRWRESPRCITIPSGLSLIPVDLRAALGLAGEPLPAAAVGC